MTLASLNEDTPVGRIAAEHPLGTRIFARHRIAFCCGEGRPLREDLPRLEGMAAKVAQVRGEKDPGRFREPLAVYRAPRAELDAHMPKEERILFPMIRAGHGPFADGPIVVMEHEHPSAARAFRRLRALTGDYEVPAAACNTWRAFWHELAAREESLQRHIDLENNIRLPRALASS